MFIGDRALSSFLPAWSRPLARRLGRESVRARTAVRERLLRHHVRRASGVRLLHGQAPRTIGPEQMVVTCLVHNGAVHLPAFIEHYRRLGAVHQVFLDHESTDDTREIIARHADTTLYGTSLSFARYQIAMKRWLVKSFGSGGWTLLADVDELWEYPGAGRLPLSGFLAYLNRRGFDAVTAHLLDLVPAEPLADIQGRDDRPLEESHRYYDLSDMERTSDPWWLRENRFEGGGNVSYTGGIKQSVWGYAGDKLTKQPLVRYRAGFDFFPYDVHFVRGACVADVTTVLRHYKYTAGFYAHVRDAVERGQYWRGAEVYRLFERVLRENPGLTLKRPASREYRDADELVERGFLTTSPEYRRWLEEHAVVTR